MSPKTKLLIIIVSVILILGEKPNLIKAQQTDASWKSPILLFNGPGAIENPILIADQFGFVHVFWRYTPTRDINDITYEQIYYMRWNGAAWSEPVDIVSVGSLRYLSAAIGSNGEIYLIWVDGTAQLFFSQAYIEDALNVKSWAEPVLLANSGPDPSIQVDSKNRLFIIFPDENGGISYLLSADGGNIWSTARIISQRTDTDIASAGSFIKITDGGIMHAVWTEYQLPSGWPPLGVFYSKSTDDGETWSIPEKMAGEGYDQINVAIGNNGVAHLAWNAMVGTFGRYHSWSNNNGNTWSAVDTIMPIGATSGPPGIVVDSTGIVHLLTTDGQAAWYSAWINGSWLTPTMLPRGETQERYYIEEAALSLNGGNQLHAVFWSDRMNLWYTTKQINAPGKAFLPLPQKVEVQPVVTISPQIALANPSPEPSAIHAPPPTGRSSSSSSSVLVFIASVIPVILLLGGFIIFKVYRNRIPF